MLLPLQGLPLQELPLQELPLQELPLQELPLQESQPLTRSLLAVYLMSPLLGDLLLACDRYALALACASVRVGSLAAHGKTLAMAEALVAADLYLPLDVLRNLAPKVTLDLVVRIDELADSKDLGIREITNLCVVVDVERFEDLIRPRSSDPEDIGETDLDPLVPREVNSGNTCHALLTPDAACGEGFRRSPTRGHAAG